MKMCKAAKLIAKPEAECTVDFAAALRLVALALALVGIIVGVIIVVQKTKQS